MGYYDSVWIHGWKCDEYINWLCISRRERVLNCIHRLCNYNSSNDGPFSSLGPVLIVNWPLMYVMNHCSLLYGGRRGGKVFELYLLFLRLELQCLPLPYRYTTIGVWILSGFLLTSENADTYP